MDQFKRFIVFGFDMYYPGGGFQDAIDSFDTLEEARQCASNNRSDYNQIFDCVERKLIEVG